MKFLTLSFKDSRLQSIPDKTVKTITLSEHKLNGTLLNEYDLSSYLKGGLPVIDKKVEKALNEFTCGALTLKSHDPDKTIDDILEQSSRKFGLKVEINLDLPLVFRDFESVAHFNTPGNSHRVWVQGEIIFVADGFNSGLYAFTFDEVAKTFTQIGNVNNGNTAFDVCADDDYVYLANNDLGFYIYTFDEDTGTFTEVAHEAGLQCHSIFKYKNYVCATFVGVLKIYSWDGTTLTELDSFNSGGTQCEIWANDDNIFLGTYIKLHALSFNEGTETLTEEDSIALETGAEVRDIGGNSSYIFTAEDEYGLCAYTFIGGTLARVGHINDLSGGSAYYWGVWADDDWIVAACRGAGLVAYSFDGATFTREDSIDEDGAEYGVFVSGNYAYVASYSYGLRNFTYSPVQEDLVLFDGMIDIQEKRRSGRNTLSLTAHTWEKEFEHHNAELVHNGNGIYFRFITGVELISLTGGTVGAKKLNYTYKTIIEDEDTIEEFGLSYEGGEEFLFREAGTYSLTGFSGQIITLEIADIADLPKKDAEDVLVVSSTIDGGEVGFWYESKTLSELVNLLLDATNFEIPDDNREININIDSLLSTTWQFNYVQENPITSDEINCCVEDNPADSTEILVALGTLVWNLSYDPDAAIRISGSIIGNITDTFASATRVDKILRLPNGNALVVCVSGTKEAGYEGYDNWSKLKGIMEIQNDGTIVHSWDTSFLDGTVPYTILAGSSVELMNYTRTTGEAVERNAFYYVAGYIYAGIFRVAVCLVDIDYNPNSLYTETIAEINLMAGPAWVAPNVVYHRYWDDTTPNGSDYHCWYLYADNSVDGEGNPIGYIKKKYTGGEIEEALTYCSATTVNSIRAIRADNSQNKFYLISSKMGSEKQYVFKCIATGAGSTDINTDPVDYFVDYPAFLPNILKPTAFEVDGAEIAHNLAELKWGVGTDNPTIESIGVGFNGWTYSPHPVCYLTDEEVYFGVSEMGNQAIAKFFICANIADAIIPIADFTGLNVREALNELASGFNCVWKRMERDKVRFVSRGSYCDTCELDNNLYKSNWQESKTKPYIGVEIKNPLYTQYEYRYPDSFNAEEGEVFKLNNRFAMPINGALLAKVNGDWFMEVRTEIEVDGFFMIELEEFDKIEWQKYLYDGTPDEQVDCILMGISYDDRTKLTRITMVGVDSYPFKQVRFRPHYFASSGS